MGTTSFPQAWSPIGTRNTNGGEWEQTATQHGIVTIHTAPAYQAAGLIESDVVRERGREVWMIRAKVRRGEAA